MSHQLHEIYKWIIQCIQKDNFAFKLPKKSVQLEFHFLGLPTHLFSLFILSLSFVFCIIFSSSFFFSLRRAKFALNYPIIFCVFLSNYFRSRSNYIYSFDAICSVKALAFASKLFKSLLSLIKIKWK